jgi:hypothetical protein
MDKEKISEFRTDIINFSRTITPLPREIRQSTSDENYIKYGDNNLYANFLLSLFSSVPLHKSICLSKVNYILGDGVVTKADGKPAKFDINAVDSFEQVVRKIVQDFIIFNTFVLEVQYDVLHNKPLSLNHIPANHLRSNKSKTKFWISDEWELRRNVLSFDRWKKGVNEDKKSKIFVFQGYVPSANNVYADVSYNSAITNMLTEILIQDFAKSSLEDGFSPSTVLSFFKGTPTDEQAREFERKLTTDFAGANGKKFLINYNDAGSEKGLQVDTISASDYAANLAEIKKQNTEAILTAHQATSPLLFGVADGGNSIGGNGNEIEKAYQIFKSVYVKDKRNEIESALNNLLSDFGLPEVEFKDRTNLVSPELDPATRQRVLLIDELRAIDFRQPLPGGEGQKLLTITKAGNPDSNSNANFEEANTYPTGRKLTGDDFEKIKHLGTHRGEYSVLSSLEAATHSREDFKKAELKFDDDKDVEDYLLKTSINGKSLSEIKAGIKKELGISITTGDLSNRIKALTGANLIKSDIVDGAVTASPVASPNANTVQVMYEYKKRDDVGGADLLPTSRDFCVKLIENDRLYTRSEIQSMSTIFGYDIMQHAGGWWFNKDTNRAENQCRHFWNMVRAIRKNK